MTADLAARSTGFFETVVDEPITAQGQKAKKKSTIHLQARQQEIREWYQTEMAYYENRYNNKAGIIKTQGGLTPLTASETQRQQERLATLLKQRTRAEARVKKEFDMQMKLAKMAHKNFLAGVKRRLLMMVSAGEALAHGKGSSESK